MLRRTFHKEVRVEHLRVIKGEKREKARDPIAHLKGMNAEFYRALKIDLLDFQQRSVLCRCLERIPLPDMVPNEAVIHALASPEKDLLEDYEEEEAATRSRWHVLLGALGLTPNATKRHEAVKRRLGLIRRVLAGTTKEP